MFEIVVLEAFGLTLFAGLSTGIGSALAFFAKKTNTKFLSVSLGFSAGVMIYVSFVDIFPEAQHLLVSLLGDDKGELVLLISFFVGMMLVAGIDRLIPPCENPHEVKKIEQNKYTHTKKCHYRHKHRYGQKRLLRLGLFTAVTLAIHNFPEGIVTFTSALHDLSIGIPIAIAIAIHNIPEGIAVSIPIYYATGSKKKAFWYSFLSGLAEPLGALIGYVLLRTFLNDIVLGILLVSVAGIMVFISLDELLPAAREYGEHHLEIYGLIAGMMVMALSLFLL